MRYLPTIIFATMATTLISCRQAEVEPMIAAGYIESAMPEESIIIKGDTIGVRHFAIDEQTVFEGGEMVEGNIAEIIYMPAEEEGELPLVLTITTDETYPKSLGRWATEGKVSLQVDIELQPRGRIVQHEPQQALRFTSWQLAGEENRITLYGTMSLPPEFNKEKKDKKEEEITIPARRERNFSISATLTKQSDSNTESRMVLVLRTENGRESKLYKQE
ncbi:MAG: hypothetical protein IKV77_12860 [Alistipes sp.]|nr:hypothetical protein [Alistipes sp.]